MSDEKNYGWCLDFIDKDKVNVLCEIGSRDGLDSIYLAETLETKENYLFEPDPDLGLEIEENIINTKGSEKFNFMNIALGEESKKETFKAVDVDKYTNKGVGSFFDINFDNREKSDPDYKREPIQKEIEVEIKRYDDLSLPAPDLIAMDVQGYELSVLKGFGKIINDVYAIVLESSISENYLGGSRVLDVYKFLNKNNFKLVKNTRNDSNKGLIREALMYNLRKKKNYIPDINLLFINKTIIKNI